MFDADKCPGCGSKDIWRDEVDIGVGIQYGPWRCTRCYWREDEPLDEAGLVWSESYELPESQGND